LAVLGETADSWASILPSKPSVKKSSTRNEIWERPWVKLTAAETVAATALGWDAVAWDGSEWLLPDDDWLELDEKIRGHLEVLGESSESWEEALKFTPPSYAAGYGGDWREWVDLTSKEQDAASKLGFTEPTWNMKEMADVHAYIRDFCGSGFKGCVTQGCDHDSIDDTVQLALAHPQVFASFGCHPKSAHDYDDAFESRLLEAFSACGKKAIAWGECGLDYSSLRWGHDEGYRQKQREVFVRQLQLAIERGLPLVLHIREASDDAILLLRRWVPSHWKAHMHSFLGGSPLVEIVLAEFPHFYFGLTGTVTMGGGAEQMCFDLPLSRLLLETDSPCIGPRAMSFSHVGQIPLIARKVAELRGWNTEDVLSNTIANARSMYGSLA